MLYPWLLAISTALKAQGEVGRNPGLIPQQIDLGKFVDVFWQVDMPRLAFNSVLITGATVIAVCSRIAGGLRVRAPGVPGRERCSCSCCWA